MQIIQSIGSLWREQPIVSGKQCIGSGIKQISSECNEHGKQHRMSTTEHVPRSFRRKFPDGSKHDFCEVFVSVLLHDRNNTPNGVNCKIKLAHSLCRLLSQMAMNSTLNGSVEHRTLCCNNRGFTSLYGGLNCLLNLFFRHVWAAENIKHGRNINTD